MTSRSRRRWILCAVVLVVGFFAARVDAQGCDPLSSWIVSLSCTGGSDNGRTICVNGTAVCQRMCNNNGDCGSAAQACVSGVCEFALLPCNNRGDCPEGFGCDGNTGRCTLCGTAGVTCGPVDRCAGVRCDDGKACNGTEVCTGGSCGRGLPPNCDDADPTTTDLCVETGVLNGAAQFRCDHYSPSRCSRRPGTGDLRLTPVGSRSVGLTWRGKIDKGLASRPNDVRFLLTDGKGAPLFDAHAGSDNGTWRGGSSGWTWTRRSRDSEIRKVTLRSDGTYRVEGTAGADRLDLGRVVSPYGAALVDFVAPDAVDVCVGIPVLECIPGDRYGMQCRTGFIGGPNP